MTVRLTTDEHDHEVRQQALRLLSQGYQIKARLEGWFDPPEFINGYRPDIVARKGDEYIIIEVKKADTDWPKIAALERFHGENPKFKFLVVTLK